MSCFLVLCSITDQCDEGIGCLILHTLGKCSNRRFEAIKTLIAFDERNSDTAFDCQLPPFGNILQSKTTSRSASTGRMSVLCILNIVLSTIIVTIQIQIYK